MLEQKQAKLEFMLNHFEGKLFPRTVSTYKSQGKQFKIFSKEEMLNAYEDSDYLDCRVNAYPSYTNFQGIQRYPPNFIFADLDLSTFESKDGLNIALSNTITIIGIKLKATPTVLWTGNGYHIYQPVNSKILEEYEQFSKFEQPSLKFIRFAESYLTGGKADPSHNPSFKSSMIRIPGSYNSKYVTDNLVRIIQKWDGYRPPISSLLGNFHVYLVDHKIKEIKSKKTEKKFGSTPGKGNSIFWIEKLLQTPIDDYRKSAIPLILAPYLITIKKVPCEDALRIIRNWLDKCSELRGLDSNFYYIINYSITTAIRNTQKPMKLSTLENKNKELYELLTAK